MSFILVPQDGEDVQVNAWNWRPTLEILYREKLIGLEQYERMGAHGCGGRVDGEFALRVAETIERKLYCDEARRENPCRWKLDRSKEEGGCVFAAVGRARGRR
jgi:hypothetical protein